MLARFWSRVLLCVALVLAAAPVCAQSYTITPTPFQTALNNSGAIITNACIWTYQAGTTTPATTYSDNAGSANTNPIRTDSAGRFTAYLIAGTSYKFVYETSCTPPAHGTTLRTADNIVGVPASAANVDITGTAGETITAGNCVYLSDGSGAKTVGLWYKCDSTNTYSSTTPEVGIAPSAITSSASGTIRLIGSVTGLSSLNVGSEYFVGSSGAITSTAPTNTRHLGHADSATSLVLTADPALPVFTGVYANDFRLGGSTGNNNCEPTDVTAVTTISWTPCRGNRITLFDSNGIPKTCTSAEISIAVPGTTSTMYDVWVFDNGSGSTCTPALEVLAWTNDTTRATAIARTTGRLTKSGNTTRLYVGSFRTTTVSGQTEDSLTKRYIWNFYNRVARPLRRIEAATSWTYATASWRQANANASNQVDVVIGVADALLNLRVHGGCGHSAGSTQNCGTAIGEDSTTSYLTDQVGGTVSVNSGDWSMIEATLSKYPAVGRHFYAWIEIIGTAVTATFYGTGALIAGDRVGGIDGYIQG